MDLHPLLVALMSENNDVRAQAEESLNNEWLHKAPDSLLLQLAAQGRVAESETVDPTTSPANPGTVVFSRVAASGGIQDLQDGG
jgi:hypothetical protein